MKYFIIFLALLIPNISFADSVNVIPLSGVTPDINMTVSTTPPSITNEQYSTILACPQTISCPDNNSSTSCPDSCSVTRTTDPNPPSGVTINSSVDAVCPVGYAVVNVNNAQDEYTNMPGPNGPGSAPGYVTGSTPSIGTLTSQGIYCYVSDYQPQASVTCHNDASTCYSDTSWGWPQGFSTGIDQSNWQNYAILGSTLPDLFGPASGDGVVPPDHIILIGRVWHEHDCWGPLFHPNEYCYYNFEFWSIKCGAIAKTNNKTPISAVCVRIKGTACRPGDTNC